MTNLELAAKINYELQNLLVALNDKSSLYSCDCMPFEFVDECLSELVIEKLVYADFATIDREYNTISISPDVFNMDVTEIKKIWDDWDADNADF